MAQLTFLQFDYDATANQYAVEASFNGHPGSPKSLFYDASQKQFQASLSADSTCETFSSVKLASTHLAPYTEYDLARIYTAGPTLSLKGGGIIKTTKFPPPNKELDASFIPVNASLLNELYLSKLSILRQDGGQNFILTLDIKNQPNHPYPFRIVSATLQPSLMGRPDAILFIEIGTGAKTQDSISIPYNNAALSLQNPCSIVMDQVPLDLNNDYSKSAWFYMLP